MSSAFFITVITRYAEIFYLRITLLLYLHMRFTLLLLLISFFTLCTHIPSRAQNKPGLKLHDPDNCDSISFFSTGKVAYLKTSKAYNYSIYTWHPNGHIRSEIINNDNGYDALTYYEDGSLRSDSVYTNNEISTESFYPNGLLQRRTLLHKPASRQFGSDPTYSSYEFDTTGQLALLIKKDNTGKEVAREKYPFAPYSTLKLKQAFYPDKSLQQVGYYVLSETGDTLKYGAWYKFHPNGQLAKAGLYSKNSPWGLHISYDSTGKIMDRNYFANGLSSAVADQANTGQSYTQGYYKVIDGIYTMTDPHSNKQKPYYFYKGLQVSEVPDARKGLDSSYLIRIAFPVSEYGGRFDYYEADHYKLSDVEQELQVIYGQEIYKYQSDGKLKTRTSAKANNKPKHRSAIGVLELKKDLQNDSTSHLFVILPCGRKIEVIDRYVAINGYWEFVSANGVKLFEGDYHDGQQGTWIAYHEKTGKPGLIQNFELTDHTSLAKGAYREFYVNGEKKTIGKYNAHRKKTGVWKEYTDKGIVYYRAHYFSGHVYGIVIMRNEGWLKQNGKMKTVVRLYWNGSRLFHRSKREYDPF